MIEREDNRHVTQIYGEDVFSIKVMRNYLSEKAYASLTATIREGHSIDPGIADEVADAMKNWAVAKGATHFTHWFQPLTGSTAEKHDSFIEPDREGSVILKFSGQELIKGEPDASSFPSGGLRATFEARGYTAWDPTSPAFIKRSERGGVLCIPTAFCSYHGEALDKKTPLLRSADALSRQVCRMAVLFGIEASSKRAYATLGAEQEYFLIDEYYYEARLDLLQTERTLFGRKPAKHQQKEDHYFGAIKPRILDFMDDLDRELWKLGIPAKTRHNEVCPAQFEIALVFEEQNLAVDHNMIVMETLRQLARRHGLVCLLHEKPFAGVNGSGKHNNWSIVGPDGKNWLSPGDNPHENAKFLTVICALMKGIDTYAGLLRASVATAGNDHRLGANEAPPAILSIFLGDQLTDIIGQIETGSVRTARKSEILQVGVTSLPPLPKDVTDRNRTSPFAFTGNKFEFRMVGSNQSSAGPNIVLNTIVADALMEICNRLEADLKEGKNFNDSLQTLLRTIITKHKRILFNGDNYSSEWKDEAAGRGLLNLRTTPEALDQMETETAYALFERHRVLSRVELKSRTEIYREQYEKSIMIEAQVAGTIIDTQIIPAVHRYLKELAAVVQGSRDLSLQSESAGERLNEIAGRTEKLIKLSGKLTTLATGKKTEEMADTLESVRIEVDELEAVVPADLWPLPSYAEMLFLM